MQLDLRDVTVLADAGLNSKKVMRQIKKQKGHYIVPVKPNHKKCFAELEAVFSAYQGESATTIDSKHGRYERRKCRLLFCQRMSERFKEKWPDARTVICIAENVVKRINATHSKKLAKMESKPMK